MDYQILLFSEELPFQEHCLITASVEDKTGKIIGRLAGRLFPYGIRVDKVWFSEIIQHSELIIMAIADQARAGRLGQKNISLAS